MTSNDGIIFIVDDDESIRRSLSILLRSAGYSVCTFSGGEVLLESEEYDGIGCIILDVFMDGASGLDLQERINLKFSSLPIIYLTALGNVPMSVKALRKGAHNFLQKPVEDSDLVAAVEEALETSLRLKSNQTERERIRSLIDTLTPRETEVFNFLIKGLLNKQIAGELDIAVHTVKLHRGKITEKLGIKSVAEMVTMAAKLKTFS